MPELWRSDPMDKDDSGQEHAVQRKPGALQAKRRRQRQGSDKGRRCYNVHNSQLSGKRRRLRLHTALEHLQRPGLVQKEGCKMSAYNIGKKPCTPEGNGCLCGVCEYRGNANAPDAPEDCHGGGCTDCDPDRTTPDEGAYYGPWRECKDFKRRT